MAVPVVGVIGIGVHAAAPVCTRRGEHAVWHVQEDGVEVTGILEGVGGDGGDTAGDNHDVLMHRLAQASAELVAHKRLGTNLLHAIGDDDVAAVDPGQTRGGNLGDVGRQTQGVKLSGAGQEARPDLGHRVGHNHLLDRSRAERILADGGQAFAQRDVRGRASEQRRVAELHRVGNPEAARAASQSGERQGTNLLDALAAGHPRDRSLVAEHLALHLGGDVGLAAVGLGVAEGDGAVEVTCRAEIGSHHGQLPVGGSTLHVGVGIGRGAVHGVVQRVVDVGTRGHLAVGEVVGVLDHARDFAAPAARPPTAGGVVVGAPQRHMQRHATGPAGERRTALQSRREGLQIDVQMLEGCGAQAPEGVGIYRRDRTGDADGLNVGHVIEDIIADGLHTVGNVDYGELCSRHAVVHEVGQRVGQGTAQVLHDGRLGAATHLTQSGLCLVVEAVGRVGIGGKVVIRTAHGELGQVAAIGERSLAIACDRTGNVDTRHTRSGKAEWAQLLHTLAALAGTIQLQRRQVLAVVECCITNHLGAHDGLGQRRAAIEGIGVNRVNLVGAAHVQCLDSAATIAHRLVNAGDIEITKTLRITLVNTDFERLVRGTGAGVGTQQLQFAVGLRGRIPALGDVQVDIIQVVGATAAHDMGVEVGGSGAPLHSEVAGDKTHRIGCRHAVGGGTGPIARATHGAQSLKCVARQCRHGLGRTVNPGDRCIVEDTIREALDAARQIDSVQARAAVERILVDIFHTILDGDSLNRRPAVKSIGTDCLHLVVLLCTRVKAVAGNGD